MYIFPRLYIDVLKICNSLRLFLKTNESFDCKINGESMASAPAQLGLFGRASTYTGCFQVCCSRCWSLQAHLRKKCYPPCLGLLYWLGLRVNFFLMVCNFWAVNMDYSMQNEIFDGIDKSLIPAKAMGKSIPWEIEFQWFSQQLVLIASLHLSIIYWSLSKNKA